MAATDVTPVDVNPVLATTPPHASGAANVILSTTTGGSRLLRGYRYQPQATATSLSSSANPSTAGQRVFFTAVVTANGGVVSGSVTFKNGSQTLGTVALRHGKARLSAKGLAPGRHTIRAVFNRNGNFARSVGSVRQRVGN